jgi:hypothetical protein
MELKDLKRNINFLIGIFIILILGSVMMNCAEEERMVPFTESEVIRLLSGDTTKSWLRIAFELNGADQGMDDCNLYTITTFFITSSDSLKYTIVSSPDYCQSQTDTLEIGDWRILSSGDNQDVADGIEFIFEGDTVEQTIDRVTSIYLNLSRSANELFFQSRYQAILPE